MVNVLIVQLVTDTDGAEIAEQISAVIGFEPTTSQLTVCYAKH